MQTADGGLIPRTWDISGNETFFFVKDVTGNKTPVRVDVGAPSGSLHVSLNGDITTAAMLSQSVNAATVNVTGPADGGAILAALRGLTLSRYTLDADSRSVPHVGPAGGAFRAAFATGWTDHEIASADMAGIALAAIKELDARVSTIALTPPARRARRAPTARRQVSSRPTPGSRRSRSPTGSSRRAWPRSRSRSRRSRAAESPRRGWRFTIAMSCRRS